MAKMKISELATEINVDKNEIVAFLQSTGFDCKSATKTIEDEQINAIRAKYAPKPAAPEKKPVVAEKKAPAEAPKKKKSSVIIVGAGSGSRPNSRPGQAQSARPAAPQAPAKQVVLGPNQMINKATGKIMEKLPPKKVEEPEEVIEVVVLRAVVVNCTLSFFT